MDIPLNGFRILMANLVSSLVPNLVLGLCLSLPVWPAVAVASGDTQKIPQRLQNPNPAAADRRAVEAYSQGVSFHRQGQIDEAVDAYQTAIDLDPQLDAAYINLSLIWIGVGQLSEAEVLLQQVLQLPDRAEIPASVHALAHYNLAVIHNRQGDAATALEDLEASLAIAPEFPQAQEFLDQMQSE